MIDKQRIYFSLLLVVVSFNLIQCDTKVAEATKDTSELPSELPKTREDKSLAEVFAKLTSRDKNVASKSYDPNLRSAPPQSKTKKLKDVAATPFLFYPVNLANKAGLPSWPTKPGGVHHSGGIHVGGISSWPTKPDFDGPLTGGFDPLPPHDGDDDDDDYESPGGYDDDLDGDDDSYTDGTGSSYPDYTDPSQLGSSPEEILRQIVPVLLQPLIPTVLSLISQSPYMKKAKGQNLKKGSSKSYNLNPYAFYPLYGNKGQGAKQSMQKLGSFYEKLATNQIYANTRTSRLKKNFWETRKSLEQFTSTTEFRMGGLFPLSSDESIANEHFIKLIQQHEQDVASEKIDYDFIENFNEDVRNRIENSTLYKFIEKLPKGANLYASVNGLVPQDYLFNVTFDDNLYFCFDKEREARYKFAWNIPDDSCKWYLLKKVREDLKENNDFLNTLNMEIQRTFSLENSNSSSNYRSQWMNHRKISRVITPLISYQPIFRRSFELVLENMVKDNIIYAELTTDFPQVYELNGTTYSPIEVAGFYSEILSDFKRKNPEFSGVRFIYQPHRFYSKEGIAAEREFVQMLNEKYPKLLAGISLSSYGGNYTALVELAEAFLDFPSNVTFFFDSAMQSAQGPSTERDLLDAILLRSKRISNSLALFKRPNLLGMARQFDIAIDHSPIYHKVIGYVSDLRNHPYAPLFSDALPILITSGDAALWGAKGLSHDWYAALTSYKPDTTDLASFKQLSFNSVLYSSLSPEEKIETVTNLEKQWNRFADNFVASQTAPEQH